MLLTPFSRYCLPFWPRTLPYVDARRSLGIGLCQKRTQNHAKWPSCINLDRLLGQDWRIQLKHPFLREEQEQTAVYNDARCVRGAL